ncbi:hypothetical protein A7E78_05540 [Syntrophotalea acetylenivorans]|uniref:methionyl-tRNA formyltransferase n=1 Tax=Syntrophotalea acetylenivorans TaxID=1842532 RepID=A0A1L3GN34_9BACT|nr:methionyl-tRNA formyltransferase [Syntrophotalea acetylenivorans]APG27353.1 hypothetical protein A7E78_05540 [Syntrophotalea acetylenivorans]
MKILYFGDADWGAAALRELVRRGHDLLGVVLRKNPTDGELEATARQLDLPIFQPQRCNDPEFLATIRSLSPELNLSVSYDQILRPPILETAPLGFVNFHAGMLPWYRGRSVINWAIINGETQIGLTAHFVDEGIDTGDIILQKSLPVTWTDTYAEVMERMIASFPGLVVDTVELLASGHFDRRPQAHLPGSYFPQRGPGDEWIDWNDTSSNIYNKIRGITTPGPGARTFLDGQPMILWRASYDLSWPKYQATPGQVVGIESSGVRVKTGDSTLILNLVELPEDSQGPRLPRFKIGTRFGINLHEHILQLQQQILELRCIEKTS